MAKILLLEADHMLANNFITYIKGLGHEVIWELDPQAAIEVADTSQPDAIILDLLLASRSGIEFLYEFRSYPEWQNLPVIIFSNIVAEEMSSCLKAFEHLNIAAYHYKPTTSLSQLGRTLERALQPVSV
jgi:DNA-binding response OmpR family regulator